MAILGIKKRDNTVATPSYQHKGDAGFDLEANFEGELDRVTIDVGEIQMVPTGLFMAIAEGYEGQVRPRSGLAIKHGLTVVNAPGTVDSSYRGEVMVGLINLGSKPFTVMQGYRVAQMIIAPAEQATIVEVDELLDTERGEGGFGSTGVQ